MKNDLLTKKFYKIREVSELTGVPMTTLRYWERRFSIIQPKRNDKGTRYYTPRDIETVRMVQYLVHDRGLHIEAARDAIRSNPEGIDRRHRAIRRLEDIRATLISMIETIQEAEKRASYTPNDLYNL